MKRFDPKKARAILWIMCIVTASGTAIWSASALSLGVFSTIGEYVYSSAYENSARLFSDEVISAYFPKTDAFLKQETDGYVNELLTQEKEAIVNLTGFENPAEAIVYYDVEPPDDPTGQTHGIPWFSDDLASGQAVEPLEQNIAPEYAGSAAFEYQKNRIREILNEYAIKIKEAPAYIKAKYEDAAKYAKQRITANKEYIYYVQEGENSHTNIKSAEPRKLISALSNTLARFIQKNGSVTHTYVPYDAQTDNSTAYEGSTVLVAMRPELFAQKQADYSARFGKFNTYSLLAGLCGVFFLGAFIGLMYLNGSKKYAAGHCAAGRVYLDVGFFLLVVAELLLLIPFNIFIKTYINPHSPESDALLIFGIICVLAVGVSAFLMWTSSLARRVRCGRAYSYTLIFKIITYFKSLFASAGASAKACWAVALYVIPMLLLYAYCALFPYFAVWPAFIIAILITVLFLIYLLKRAAMIKQIQTGVEKIAGGDLSYAIPAAGEGELGSIAAGVNHIADGMAKAVNREVKAERMKTELITNISHDLKTPLTSILTYADLLKKETELPQNAQKYVSILDAKSRRLKTLTDDLFDAAKASSGDMTVACEKIDISQFMEQALAEAGDIISDSPLTFVYEGFDRPIYINADGKLLYRVISNLLDNAVKYAAHGSRVYVSAKTETDGVTLTIKNVSAAPLNITAEELTERFVRGDGSRNTEGSGLGLSIARDFMKLMGGELVIEIDGDLFKASVHIGKWEGA